VFYDFKPPNSDDAILLHFKWYRFYSFLYDLCNIIEIIIINLHVDLNDDNLIMIMINLLAIVERGQ
jgi:hypothetical protein